MHLNLKMFSKGIRLVMVLHKETTVWGNSHSSSDGLRGPPWSRPPRLTSSPAALPLSHSAPALLASPLSLEYPQYVLASESWCWLSLYSGKDSSSRNLTVVFKCHLPACIKWHIALHSLILCGGHDAKIVFMIPTSWCMCHPYSVCASQSCENDGSHFLD